MPNSATVVTMAAVMVGYRLFTLPGLGVGPGTLSITNPTRRWHVPAELITGTDDSLTYVRGMPVTAAFCAPVWRRAT